MYQAWFTGEAQVSETFPTRNEFGRRDVAQSNANLNVDLFPLPLVERNNNPNLRGG